MDKSCVVYVIDEYQLAINIGKPHGVSVGDKYQVYELSNKEIIDPYTNHSLGHLEIIKGTGKVISVQESMSIIKSIERSITPTKIIKKSSYGILPESEEYITPEALPFEKPKVGDFVKKV